MPPHPPALVLFDIDGTLMITRGAGSRCIERACKGLFGDTFEWGPITVGTLDPQIFADLCRHNGIHDPETHHQRYREAYLLELKRELVARRSDVVVMPGIIALLQRLWQRDDVVTGLLTGNYAAAVDLKLTAAGIDRARFPILASAEDGPERADLVPAACDQYAGLIGHRADPRRAVVVGDTPRDIECAHAHGCHAFAVATGRYTPDQLTQAGADTVVNDLSNPAPLERVIQESAANEWE